VWKDIRCTDFPESGSSPLSFVTQALSCHRASSFDMVSWAPSRDKRVELFSRASVPPAIVSKDDREWNDVLPPIVRGEHTDDGAFLGRRRAVPLRFRHSTTFPGWFAAHWATNSSGKKRTETEARLGVPGLDKLGVLRHQALWAYARIHLKARRSG